MVRQTVGKKGNFQSHKQLTAVQTPLTSPETVTLTKDERYYLQQFFFLMISNGGKAFVCVYSSIQLLLVCKHYCKH